jgi:hypothetical protein
MKECIQQLKKNYFFLVLMIGMSFTQGINAQTPSDYQQLKDWYLNNNGSTWGVNWGLYIDDPQMQAWTGVTVDLTRKFVTKIELTEKNINCALPNFSMPEIEELTITRCGLKGAFPTLSLPKLKILELSFFNDVKGAFPNLQMPELTYLDLSGIRFVGELPSLLYLSKLKFLRLFGCSLSGALPDLNWAKLESVYLINNEFSGNFPIFNSVTPLKEFDISRNKFTGPLPNLNKCPELLIAELSYNQFSGTIPAFDLKKIKTLNLSSNLLLTGSIPLFVLPKLEYLFLSGKGITGEIPNFDLPMLKGLSISNTNNTGKIPNFNLLPALAWLEISDTKNTGEIPNFSTQWLDGLTIDGTENTGNIPNFNLPHLSHLTIVNTKVSGSVPRFSNIPYLMYLRLYSNQLTGEIPKLRQNSLIYMSLSNNRLTGTIPKLSLPRLRELYLRNNALSGSFPSMDSLKLTTLNLSGNKLSGVIPNLELSSLVYLVLAYNEFTSFVPTFKSYNLREINVQNNKFTGEIKGILTPNLEYLILDSNQIKSIVVNNTFTNLKTFSLKSNLIEDFPNITVLPNYGIDLRYNKLKGCIPPVYMEACTKGGINISSNPLLPWEGDLIKICDNPITTNAPCNDSDPTTIDDKINTNCECVGKIGIFSSNTAPCPNDTVHYVIKQNLAGTFQWKTIPDGFIQGNDKDYKKVIVKNTGQAVELILWNTASNTTVTATTITPYASSAGTMTTKFLQTAKTNKTITVKHQNSSIKLGANDTYAYVLHEGNADKIINQLDINKTGVFAFDVAKMKCGKVYYVSYLVGKGTTGFPNLADKCTNISPKGQAISWLCSIKNPVAMAREEDENEVQNIDNQINVYPNPTDDKFIIELPDVQNATIDLYNIQGQVLLSQKEMNVLDANHYEASVTHLPKGIYVLKINLDNQINIQKIIIQ